MTIGERITLIRKENGLSQDAFGTIINVSRQSISKWEANTSIPEVDKIIEISKKFNVSIEWLLGIKESRNITNDFSEEQLNKIEEIIKKHATIKPKKNYTSIIMNSIFIFAFIIVLIISGTMIKNKFYTLWLEINSIYSQINDVKDTLENQNEYFEKVETMLNEQKELIIEEITFDQYDLKEETVHILIKVRPKEYQENIQVYLNVDNGINAITQQAKEIENRLFYANIKIQLTDLIEVSGKVIHSNSEKYVSLTKFENKLSNTYYIPEKDYEAEYQVYSEDKQIFYITNELYTPDEVNPLEIKKVVTYIFVDDELFNKQDAYILYDQELKMNEYKTVIDFSSLDPEKNYTFEFIHVLTDSHDRSYVIEGQWIEKSILKEGDLAMFHDRHYEVDKNFNWQQYE